MSAVAERSLRGLALACVLGSISACGSNGLSLAVELRTDLGPSTEFSAARVTIDGRDIDHYAAPDGDYVTGERIAEIDGLAAGTFLVTVALLDRSGVVLERTLRVDVRANTGVLVVMTRSCQDIACPAPGGDPTLTTCVAGQCVDPRCVEAGPLCPDAECVDASDCAVAVACAVPLCESGVCLRVNDDRMCNPDEFCDPDLGCRDLGGALSDAGPAMDTGPRDSGGGDTGTTDTGTADTGTPGCTSERMLAVVNGNDSGRISARSVGWNAVITHDPGGAEIGDMEILFHQYVGVTSIRPEDDPDFAAVVGAFTSGTATRASVSVNAGGGGAYMSRDFSASLVGKRVTRVRRRVTDSSILWDGGGTDFDVTLDWEFMGCDP